MVAPDTVPPVNVELVVIPVTLNVVPELFLNVIIPVPELYVPPVTNISVGLVT